LLKSRVQTVNMVAVNGVNTHANERRNHTFVLSVPSDAIPPEAMEEGGKPAGPIGVMKIHSINATSREFRCAPFGTIFHQTQAS
jgi:hypothetical protein